MPRASVSGPLTGCSSELGVDGPLSVKSSSRPAFSDSGGANLRHVFKAVPRLRFPFRATRVRTPQNPSIMLSRPALEWNDAVVVLAANDISAELPQVPLPVIGRLASHHVPCGFPSPRGGLQGN